MTLRIASYNIRGGLGMDGVRSVERIADVLREMDADIVCLQEVHQNLPWSGFSNQPRRLRSLLGRQAVFQRCVSLWLGGFGNAVVVNAPVLCVRRHKLPGGREPRGCLEVLLETRLGKLTVFSTHLGLTETERRAQTQCVADLARAAETPVIVCGDWNEAPDAGCVPLFLETTGFRDAGANGDFTYPADAPRVRIDYLFVSESLAAENFRTISVFASDHYPVVAKIKREI